MKSCPKKFINIALKTHVHEANTKRQYQSVNLPYIRSASHEIERILKEVGIHNQWQNCFGQLRLNLQVTQFLESCLDEADPASPNLNNVVGFVYNILCHNFSLQH